MSETTKCEVCGCDTPVSSAPSPEAGEREVREALTRALEAAPSEDYAVLARALKFSVVTPSILADALLARRAPRVEAGEVTEAMVRKALIASGVVYERETGGPLFSGIREDHECDDAVATITTALRTGGEPETCEWYLSHDDWGIWSSGCGKQFEFNTDGPKENSFNFCHACGKPVTVAPTPTPEATDA